MKTLQDLLARRDLFVGGVIEIHIKGRNALRGTIRFISLENKEVQFTILNAMEYSGKFWESSDQVPDGSTCSYGADLVTTENERPQFDLGGGSWVIIYPNTDSVRIP